MVPEADLARQRIPEADEPDLELSASSLRADASELGMSIEMIASKLEDALPQIARVQRRKVGGFRSKKREVQSIELPLGEEQFALERAPAGLRCTRHKVVRGITISREELSVPDWITQVIAAVTRTAELSERSRMALEGLLR